MHELFHLLMRRRQNARMVVPGIDNRDAGKAIKVGLPVDIGDGPAVGRGDDDRLQALRDDGENIAAYWSRMVIDGAFLLTLQASTSWSQDVVIVGADGHFR